MLLQKKYINLKSRGINKMLRIRKYMAMVLSIAILTLSGCAPIVATQTDSTVAASTASYRAIKTTKKMYMYDFGTSRNYGCTNTFGDTIDFEGYAGIRLDTSNNKIKYAVYNHRTAKADAKNIKVNLYKASDNEKFIKTLATMSVPNDSKDSEWNTINDSLSDGLYRIEASFTIKDRTLDVPGYVYIYNGNAQTCRLTKYMSQADDSMFNKITKDANPNDYLSNAKNTYPANGTGNSCNHVKLWEKKADEILKEKCVPNASDEFKVFIFTKWLSENIAYDEWRATVNKNQSRGNYYGDFSRDDIFSYYNGVGTCWDFANIMAIMCRHVGIPCTDLSNDGHTVTCVWMNNRWYAIDCTVFTKYTNWEEVPDPDKYDVGEWRYPMSRYYGYFDNRMTQIDKCIWEPKNNGTGK